MGMHASTLRAQLKDMWLHAGLAQKLAIVWFGFLTALIILLGIFVEVGFLIAGGIILGIVATVSALVSLID